MYHVRNMKSAQQAAQDSIADNQVRLLDTSAAMSKSATESKEISHLLMFPLAAFL